MSESAAAFMGIPLAWYRDKRAHEPVSFDDKFKSWNVFRYADAATILNDGVTYSSEPRPGAMSLPSIVGMDGARHRKLRGLVTQAFTPRMAEQLGPRITEVAAELLDGAIARGRAQGHFDAIADFSYPLPIRIIAEMLGIPFEDQSTFRRWSETLIAGPRTDALRGRSFAEERAAALRDLNQYMLDQLAARRRAPGPDLITRLLAAEVDGERLSETELLEFCRLLLIAGYETTACLIGNAVMTLNEHPDFAAELRADPTLMAGFTEEVVRCYPSVAGTMRVATADVELGGQAIAKGDALIVWTGSANYDEAQFPDAERFDPRRTPNRHLGFGVGAHFCLGAPLARLEARIAVGLLLDRLPTIARDRRAPVEKVDSPFLFGVRHFPLAL